MAGGEMAHAKIQRLGRFAYLSTMSIWGLMAYAEILKIWRKGELFGFVRDGQPYVSDFALYYQAAVLGKKCLEQAAQHINIYDAMVQHETMRSFMDVMPQAPMYLQYPPYFFTLQSPLGFLSIDGAFWLFTLASLLCAFATFHFCLAPYLKTRTQYWCAAILIFSSFPFWQTLRLGQSALFLMASFYFSLMIRHGIASGASAFYTLIKLQYLPTAGLTGLLRSKLPFAIGICAAGALLTIGACLTLGWHNVVAFPNALFNHELNAPAIGVSQEEMQNVRGQAILLTRMIMKDAAVYMKVVGAMTIGAFACMLAYTGWVWWRLRKIEIKDAQHPLVALAICITLIGALIASPHTHKQDYVLLALPAVICFWLHHNQILQTERARRLIARANRLCWWLPLLSWPFFVLMFLFQFMLVQPFFVYALALLVIVVACFELEYAEGPNHRD
jgi:hypothetical protein